MEKGFKYAKLSLDEPRAIYYSGQVLSGNIECELSQPINYSAINLNFNGKANVFWTESEFEEYNGIRRNIVLKYVANEEYFNITQCVSRGMGVVTLPPGLHKIPFQFQIPYIAPSSFKGERGSITYKITAYIEYPDPTMERDQLEKEFEVVAPLDFNKGYEDAQAPIDLEFEEFYSCCCSSSPMTITINIPASGFCPGQAIPINVNANNDSNVEIKKIIFQLIQKECYHSKEPHSDYIPPEVILKEVKTGPIMTNTKRELTTMLVVPDMIVPNLQNCSIIDVGHFVKIIIKMSGCNDDLEDETEICLGLVPLASLLQGQEYKHPMQSDLPQGAIPEDPPAVSVNVQNNFNYPTVTPIQNTTAYPTASPYPNPSGAYPNQSGPYPNQSGPYPNQSGPYPNPNGSYPNSTGYNQTPAAPYPQVSPYPNSTPYPPSNEIPLAHMPSNNIGFTTQHNPQFYPQNNPSYPNMGNQQGQGYSPYPTYGTPSAPPPN